MTGPTGTERLAYIQDIKMVENGWPILPTLIGQALEAVQLKDPQTGARQPFTGVRVSQALMNQLNGSVNHNDFIHGLT